MYACEMCVYITTKG